ncbi:hypothetical protein LXA43DRAFT_714426 [Ganoderma leucocontextum]|nr:hypothetical protein LXA43DRAFT_714426 [Ganoderma leucocontextum]
MESTEESLARAEPLAAGGPATVAVHVPTTPEQWEQKLAQLRAVNGDLQRRKAESEKDRDLFRDLYSKASMHASEVSKENNELTERAALAETQARDGIVMVKATYEERIRLLEQEVERWKRQVQVLTERDRRMNDELRRRAALEPELRTENMCLMEQLDGLENYRRMEGTLEGLARQQVEETRELEETAKNPIQSAIKVEPS